MLTPHEIYVFSRVILLAVVVYCSYGLWTVLKGVFTND